MDNVFTSAWVLARKGSARYGSSPALYFACALRLVYADRAKALARAMRPVVAYAKLVVAQLTPALARVAHASRTLRLTLTKGFAMFIVIFRPHNELNCTTRHIGPFSLNAAYDYLCSLPALGVHERGGIIDNSGVKYIEPLEMPLGPAD